MSDSLNDDLSRLSVVQVIKEDKPVEYTDIIIQLCQEKK